MNLKRSRSNMSEKTQFLLNIIFFSLIFIDDTTYGYNCPKDWVDSDYIWKANMGHSFCAVSL